MKKKVNLSFACPIPWEEMKPMDAQNRFCSSCKKNVRDFTKAEITDSIELGCGRFRADQVASINRTFNSSYGQVLTFTLASLLGLAPLVTSAQSETDSVKTKIAQDSLSSNYHISGVIRDNHTNEPIPFANVVVKSKEGILIAGSNTDFDGKFSLEIKLENSTIEGATLQITSIGYPHKAIELSESNLAEAKVILNIEMDPQADFLVGEIVIIHSPPFDGIGKTNISGEEYKNMGRR